MPQTLSLHEIVDLLEIDDSIQASAIVIQPPENATAHVSDEESGDEGGGTINNLPGSLLRAPAYIIRDGYETYLQMKHISALMNPWFLILVVSGANNIFGESPFDLAISFDVVQHVWGTLAGFSHIRVKIQILNMGNMVLVHQLSFSLVRHLQSHTLDNTILYFITFLPVLHLLISSVQWDIRQQVQ
jgi:hypothetical protein